MKSFFILLITFLLASNAYAKREIVVCLGTSTVDTYSEFLFEILIPPSINDEYYILKLEGYGKVQTLVKSKIHKDDVIVKNKKDYFNFTFKNGDDFFSFYHRKGSSLDNNIISLFAPGNPLNILENITRLECSLFYR